jgi:hypothetical protein
MRVVFTRRMGERIVFGEKPCPLELVFIPSYSDKKGRFHPSVFLYKGQEISPGEEIEVEDPIEE